MAGQEKTEVWYDKQGRRQTRKVVGEGDPEAAAERLKGFTAGASGSLQGFKPPPQRQGEDAGVYASRVAKARREWKAAQATTKDVAKEMARRNP